MERLLKNLYRSSIHVCLRIKCCSFPYQLFSYCLQLSPICFMQHLSILQEMLEPSQKGLLLGPLPTHTLSLHHHVEVSVHYWSPLLKFIQWVHNRGQRGDAHGWLVYSHPSQSIGAIANTVECQFCCVLLILWSLQASNSTTKGSYGLARLLLLVYNIEVVEKPFVLWRMDQIAILAMQNKMVSILRLVTYSG
jgi:hypothetical protein